MYDSDDLADDEEDEAALSDLEGIIEEEEEEEEEEPEEEEEDSEDELSDEEEDEEEGIQTVEDDPDDIPSIPATVGEIKGLRYYIGNRMLKTKKDLESQIRNGHVSKNHIWVAYKPKGHPDQEAPWTGLVIDGEKTLLNKWIKTRSKTSINARKDDFPPEVEEYAVQVYQEFCEKTKGMKQKDVKKLALRPHREMMG